MGATKNEVSRLAWPCQYELALPQYHERINHLIDGESRLVERRAYKDAALREDLEGLDDEARVDRVECTRWLVEKHDWRIAHELDAYTTATHLPTRQTLEKLGIPRRTFARWYARYLDGGPEALEDRPSAPSRVWNRLPENVRKQIIDMALEESELSPRELATKFTDEKQYFVCEATVYRLLKAQDLIASPAYIVIKARDEFHTKTMRPNEMWQTDFTYFKLIGWGWVYLSTVLDDYSRYIISWKLCTTMTAGDVTDTLDLALAASGCDSATVLHMPRLLSDNGPSYVAGELAAYIEAQSMSHVRGAPFHPQTQGKIERWHQTLKNRILLENYYLPGDLEAQIEAFIEHYNHQRYHESLGNVTPADAYFGRDRQIHAQRAAIKKQTIEHRRLQHRKLAA